MVILLYLEIIIAGFYDKIKPNQVIVEVNVIKKKLPFAISLQCIKNEIVDDSWLWDKRFVT